MQNLAGTPGVIESITPLGSIPANNIKGIVCVQGETKRGDVGKNTLIGTWPEFVRKHGGLHADSDFPLMCKHALDSGSKLRVSRAFHFDNIDDATTVEGSKATADLDNDAVAPVAAVAELTIATWTGSGSNLTLTVPDLTNPSTTVTIANYNGTAAQTQAQAAAAVMAAINAGTNVHKYSATNPTGAKIVIAADSDLGSLANGFVLGTNITAGTLSAVSGTFTGGLYAGGAYISFVLAAWTGTGSNLNLTVPSLSTPGQTIELVNYDGLGAQTIPQALIAVAAAVNANTSTTNYSAILLPNNKIVFKKDDSFGAGGNGSIATLVLAGGSYTSGNLKFANGVTTYGALTSTWDASAVGDGYKGTVIDIVPSSNGKDGYVDITITLPDSDLPQPLKGVKRTLLPAELVSLNKQMEGVVVSNLASNTLPLGKVVLAGGAQDVSLIDDTDYTGSAISSTGWHAFNDVVDSMRMFNIARPTHGAALGLMLYLEGRKDMRGRTYTPKGLTVSGLNDFRDGTGPYVHSPLDSYFLDLWVAEVNITDPHNVNVKEYPILGGGLQCGNRSKADNAKGEWYSDSGNDFGKIFGVNSLPLNLGSPGNTFQYGAIYEKGVNAIINDESFKIVNWGNRTTLLDTTSLMSKANIADLVIFISREVKKIARKMNFKPNDILMFEELYRKVSPFIKDTLVAGRAIEGGTGSDRGEGVWWHWLGDQFAKDLNDLKVNNKAEVDAGKYRVRFAFKPIAANEYIGLDIAPADSVTILNVAQLSNLNA